MSKPLSFFGGFKLTFQHLGNAAGHDQLPPGQTAQAAAPARSPRAQPLRRRHGEVHWLRAVRGRVSGQLHLRARARQPARPPGQPGGALRLHLRDQLSALHPLRPVRGGLPDSSHHRVQDVRVLLHQPRRRHLHQGRTRRRRRWLPQTPALGGLARGGVRDDRRLDARDVSGGRRQSSKASCSGPETWASGCRPPKPARARTATTRRPVPSSYAAPSSVTSTRSTSTTTSAASKDMMTSGQGEDDRWRARRCRRRWPSAKRTRRTRVRSDRDDVRHPGRRGLCDLGDLDPRRGGGRHLGQVTRCTRRSR